MNQSHVLPLRQRLHIDTPLTGAGVTVGFLDGGFAYHEDIVRPASRLKACFDAVCPGKEMRLDTDADLSAYHGTSVLMTAISRGYYGGIAPDIDIVLVDVGREFVLKDEVIVRGFRWFLDNHKKYDIRIIVTACNASRECLELDSVVDELFDCGVIVVAAVGNGAGKPEPPSTARSCIAVGGYNDGGDGLSYSQYIHKENDTKPTIVAPAVNIPVMLLPGYVSTDIAKQYFAGDESLSSYVTSKRIISPDYRLIDGTSLSAPIVASVVALMLQHRPSLTPKEILQIMRETSMSGVLRADKMLSYI